MPIHIQKNISLKQYSTFNMGGIADYFIVIKSESELLEALSFIENNALPFYILGGGSNTLFMSSQYKGCILKIDIPGESWKIKGDQASVKVGAGRIWDDFVLESIQKGFAGLQALSLIPGSVGATPVQNVGAYGQEVKNVIEKVRVYDTNTKKFKVLSNKDCQFAYRDSIFKKLKGRYIITYVYFKLQKNIYPDIPKYLDLSDYFASRQIEKPSLKEIRDAVVEIRIKKLPDPKEIASVGSFFKNSLIESAHFKVLKLKHPHIKFFYDKESDLYKIPTGWLIDSLGKKGLEIGNLGFYRNNALVITNTGNATGKELEEFIIGIISEIRDYYGIDVQPEPSMIYDTE